MFGFIVERIRAVVGCVCFIACIGPILIIVGIVFLVKKNTRNDDINTWKAAITDFDASSARGAMMLTSAWIGSNNLTLVENNVVVSGSQENIPSTTSLVLETYSAPSTSWSVDTAIDGSRLSTVTPPDTPETKQSSTTVTCTRSYCSTGCSSSSSSSSSYTCNNMASRACAGGTYSGQSSCRSGVNCGTCKRDTYLTGVCFPLKMPASGTAGWTASVSRRSCEYPFGNNQYYGSDYTSSIQVKLMSENDPYITLGAATGGDRDFGMTEGAQRGTGTGLLIAGILIAVCMYSLLALLIKRFLMPALNGENVMMGSPSGQGMVNNNNGQMMTHTNPIDTIHVNPGPMSQYPAQQQQQQQPIVYGSASLQHQQQQPQPVYGQPVYAGGQAPPGYVQQQQQPQYGGAYPPPSQPAYGGGPSYAMGPPPPAFGLGKV